VPVVVPETLVLQGIRRPRRLVITFIIAATCRLDILVVSSAPRARASSMYPDSDLPISGSSNSRTKSSLTRKRFRWGIL